jgi:phage/plasmid-like protein (TIGR03299 family)
MAHELDHTDGQYSFADSRTDAWHQLGQQVNHAMNAEEALREAHLAGWDVRKMPLSIPQEPVLTEDGVTTPPAIEVPDRFATVRTNPINGGIDYLGVVGPQYTPIQNEEHADLLNALVEESGSHFETAGALRGGRQTFITMKLPESMELDGPGGADRTDLYIAATNSHDGSSAFRLMVTPVRIVCANTQSTAISAAVSRFSIRHTSGARSAISEAREALGLTFKYVKAFEEECKRLVEATIEEDEIRTMLETVYRVEKAASERQRDTRQGHVSGTLKMLTLPTNAAIAGTRYGAYNAVTEYVDHFWPTRGGLAKGVNPEAAVEGEFADLKSRAFQLLSV